MSWASQLRYSRGLKVLGSARVACWFRRRAETGFTFKLRELRDAQTDQEFAIARTRSPARDACAPQRFTNLLYPAITVRHRTLQIKR
jgi:hypothetical protein